MSDSERTERIVQYLMEFVEGLDGDGLVITDWDLIHKRFEKLRRSSFPTLREICAIPDEPRSDVGSLEGLLDRNIPLESITIPEAQEPVKCGNCGWIGFSTELDYPFPQSEGPTCPACGEADHIGSVIPTSEAANVEPVVHCGLCAWKGTPSKLDREGVQVAPKCPNCGSSAFLYGGE